MATKTTNYNLTKPSYSENADISVINSNMDIIDSKMKELENKAGTGGSGSNVEWNQIQTSGTKIAEVTIDGTMTEVYAPSESGGGSDDVDLTQAEYDALSDTKLTDNKNYFINDASETNGNLVRNGKSYTGGGSGSGYSETLLFENTGKVSSGTIALSDSILNYNQLVFEVTNNNETNWNATSFCNYLVSAISDRIGGQTENKGIIANGVSGSWNVMFFTTENSITFGDTASLLVKRIYGIKF